MEQYEILSLSTNQLPAAMALVWEVFAEFEAPDYSEEGIEEFRAYIHPRDMRRRVQEEGLALWGLFAAGTLAGVLACRPEGTPPHPHISLLFVQKQHHRKGFARALFQNMKKHCLAQGLCGPVTVNSSPYAAKAYRRLGFQDTGPQQTVNGLLFIPMQAPL